MPAILSRPIWAQADSFTARRPLVVALPFGIFLAAFVYFLCRSRGFFSDEGSYCTIAQGILRGELPYRSYFNEKPPLQYFWTAAIMALSAPTISGARLASAAALMLTAAFILRGPAPDARRNLPALLGWTGLIFLVALDMAAFNDTAETSLAVLFAGSALLIANPGSDGFRLQRNAAVQGAIFGVAIGFRQAAIAPALVMLLLPHATLPKRAYLCGLAVGLLCWLGPLFALGIGSDFFDSVVRFHFNNPSVATYFRGSNENERIAIAVWLLCFGWLASLKEYRGKRLWLIVWFAAMALPFFGRMDVFRLWPSTAAMLVLLARANHDGLAARAVALATAAIALVALLLNRPATFPESLDVSNDIAAMTRPDDRVWAGPFNPLRYCLAQRQPASRYYFILPWTAKAEVRQEIVADIVKSPAKLIAIDHMDSDSHFGVRHLLPELRDVLAKNYHFTHTRRGTDFYVRNAVTAGTD
jgi:hypothetical protein